MQSDFHGPVKMVKRIWDFKWTMAKLVLVLNKALDKEVTNLTHFSKFIKGVMKNENKKLENQGVQLKHYKGSLQNVKDHYLITVLSICKIVETCFDGIFDPQYLQIKSHYLILSGGQ